MVCRRLGMETPTEWGHGVKESFALVAIFRVVTIGFGFTEGPTWVQHEETEA